MASNATAKQSPDLFPNKPWASLARQLSRPVPKDASGRTGCHRDGCRRYLGPWRGWGCKKWILRVLLAASAPGLSSIPIPGPLQGMAKRAQYLCVGGEGER